MKKRGNKGRTWQRGLREGGKRKEREERDEEGIRFFYFSF